MDEFFIIFLVIYITLFIVSLLRFSNNEGVIQFNPAFVILYKILPLSLAMPLFEVGIAKPKILFLKLLGKNG